MADGFTIEAKGIAEARRALRTRAMRVADMRPALRVVAQEIEKRTSDSFQNSRSQFGEPFAPLAPSTIAGRIRKQGSANRRTKAGKLTKGAVAMRGKLTAPGGIKPLIDTGRMKNSAHAVVEDGTKIRFSAVGYLGPHITGGQRGGKANRPPMRNPTVFVRSGGGGFDFLGGSSWKLDASMQLYLTKAVSSYIATGKVVTS
jgi:hypothetical protein